MKAEIQSWQIRELGPDFSTREEHRDSNGELTSVTMDSISDVTLHVRVAGGDDAQEFLDMVKQLSEGAKINRIDIETKNTGTVRSGRKYIFT
jgi:hypothetical protein